MGFLLGQNIANIFLSVFERMAWKMPELVTATGLEPTIT